VSDTTGSNDAPDQLQLIHAHLVASNPELYRHLALYLQVLREVLAGRVRQACFHLATQVHPHRYTLSPLGERRHLHRRISLLVHRCSSLLTVEQLAALAAQIDLERRRHPSRRRRGPQEDDGRTSHGAPTEESDQDFHDLPEGSVRLDLSPPLSGNLFAWEPPDPMRPDGEAGQPFRFGAGHSANPEPEEGEEDAVEDDDDNDDGLGNELAGGRDPSLPSPWLQGELPKDPLTLLRWLDGMERALARRLRNLSHALNVELLRAGLSDGLLPVNLLDAVLEGALEPEAAPANLLRLQLPFRPPEGEGPFQAMAVLLRCPDLELEEPRLRTCRRRLQQHRQEVRRMARQFRLLQRRLQAQEAERLWLQDIATMDPSGD
jgi:hypothetical protein